MVQYDKVLAFLAPVNDTMVSEIERDGEGSGEAEGWGRGDR